MKVCQQTNCEAEATRRVFWPGQTTDQCEQHAAALVRLGKHMDIDVETAVLLEALRPFIVRTDESEPS